MVTFRLAHLARTVLLQRRRVQRGNSALTARVMVKVRQRLRVKALKTILKALRTLREP
jgi:hypothetical protein